MMSNSFRRYVNVPDNLDDWQEETTEDNEDGEDSSPNSDSPPLQINVETDVNGSKCPLSYEIFYSSHIVHDNNI